jgi:CheY-like chemotaxis protein
MHRILAIEPDSDRGALLRQLVSDGLNTDLVLAASTDAAISAMTDTRPDLILTSMLMSADEEQNLVAHLRATPSLRYIPLLTIPVVTDLSPTQARSNGLFSRLLRRRQPAVWPPYNFNAVITRIEEALEQSKTAVPEADEPLETSAIETVVEDSSCTSVVESPAYARPLESAWLSRGSMKRAQRWALSDLPWLSGVRLPWGQHLRVLNISSSGMLVESGVRLTPGSQTSFRLSGPEPALVVPGRVVRCRVSTVDALGVKYETAAAFDQPVNELIGAGEEPTDATMQLAELVSTLEAHAEHGASPAELRAEFEAGILSMVTARDIRLRDVPVVENDGRESVYFTVPSADGSPAVLQVTFNANDEPSAEDFEVLTAAAEIAAAVLPLTGTTRQTSLQRRMFIAAPTLRAVGEESTPRELQIA